MDGTAGEEHQGPLLPDRRTAPRLQLALPLLITSHDRRVPFGTKCDTVDVAAGGVQVILPRALPTGTRLRLDILCSSRYAKAKVVRCRPRGDGTWEIGLAFVLEGDECWLRKPS
jgi:hypothetical protein